MKDAYGIEIIKTIIYFNENDNHKVIFIDLNQKLNDFKNVSIFLKKGLFYKWIDLLRKLEKLSKHGYSILIFDLVQLIF